VILHQYGRAIPFGASVFEVADQFAFLAVDADDGEALLLEATP
jgi:response regulator RpfG family c-di-GMP phosphodiesterase